MNHRRLCRLIGDGRLLVLALDHSAVTDAFPHLADPAAVLRDALTNGADAVLTSPGILKRFGAAMGSLPVILRVDSTRSPEMANGAVAKLLFDVEDALRWGADAVACMVYTETLLESDTLANLAHLARNCAKWGMPLIAEVIPGGFRNEHQHTMEAVRHGARVAVELGADIVKTMFVGGRSGFAHIIKNACAPVLVLGGPRTDDRPAFLHRMVEALRAGAAGLVVGRNIWQEPNPGRAIRELADLVHGCSTTSDQIGPHEHGGGAWPAAAVAPG